MIYYLKSKERYKRKIYKITDKVAEVNWINILAILNRNGVLYIHSKLVVESYNLTLVAYLPFNQTITKLIQSRRAIVAIDASVRGYNMEGF